MYIVRPLLMRRKRRSRRRGRKRDFKEKEEVGRKIAEEITKGDVG